MKPKQESLFQTILVPAKEGSGQLFDEELVTHDELLTCLGMTFENDDAHCARQTGEIAQESKGPLGPQDRGLSHR